MTLRHIKQFGIREDKCLFDMIKEDDKGQVRVIGGKLLPYELNHSPTDACQSLQLPH